MEQNNPGTQYQQASKIEERLERIQRILQDFIVPRIDETVTQVKRLHHRLDKPVKEALEIESEELKKQVEIEMTRKGKQVNEISVETGMVEKQELKERKTVDKKVQQLKEELKVTNNKLVDLYEELKGEMGQTRGQKHRDGSSEVKTMTGPFRKNFTVEGNMIQLAEEVKSEMGWEEPQQILLDIHITKRFILSVNIKQTKLSSGITVGIVDALYSKDSKYSYDSGHAICYDGRGWLYNGSGDDGRCSVEKYGDTLRKGMTIMMDVHMQTCTIYFTLKGDGYNNMDQRCLTGTRRYQVSNPMLREPTHRFVPYFQLMSKEDIITSLERCQTIIGWVLRSEDLFTALAFFFMLLYCRIRYF